ncbi:MAG: hypothetical protein HY735_05945 [Verrucomicrobia bacterium]|nr:hypothetical protein [Verrucomicrobiota bacterium]
MRVFAVRDGGDVEDGIRPAPWNIAVTCFKPGITRYSTGRGQGVIAGVVTERAVVAHRPARVNATSHAEVGLGSTW